MTPTTWKVDAILLKSNLAGSHLIELEFYTYIKLTFNCLERHQKHVTRPMKI